jgi:hypothetical protein
MSMKAIGLVVASVVLVSLLALPGTSRAQFEGVLEYKWTHVTEDGTSIPASWKVWAASRAWRTEMVMDLSRRTAAKGADKAAPVPATQKWTTLGKLADPTVTYFINDERKVYAVVKADDAGSRPETPWTVERRGRDSVVHYACEKVLLRDADGNEIDGCVAKDVPGYSQWLTAMRRQGHGPGMLKALQAAGVEGFFVRLSFKEKGRGQPSGTMELVRAERQPVPASLLEIPPGYRQVDLMMVHMTPEQEQKWKESQQKMQEMLQKLPPEQRKKMEEMMRGQGSGG